MTEPVSRSISNWASGIALVGSIISVGVLFGSTLGRVERAEKDIERIQADNRTAQVTLNQIDTRTARMEAKLEILLPTSALKAERE